MINYSVSLNRETTIGFRQIGKLMQNLEQRLEINDRKVGIGRSPVAIETNSKLWF